MTVFYYRIDLPTLTENKGILTTVYYGIPFLANCRQLRSENNEATAADKLLLCEGSCVTPMS